MSVADAIHGYHERSMPHLARLRILTGSEAGPPPSPGVAAEVATATSAVLAQAEAASRLALAATRRGSSGDVSVLFQAARLARLTAAADEAVAAARHGNAATLRERLLRFDTLTAAIYTAERPDRETAMRPVRPGNGGQ